MKCLLNYLDDCEIEEVLKRNKKFLSKVQHCIKNKSTFEECYKYVLDNRVKFSGYYIIVDDNNYTDYILYRDVYVEYTRCYK